MSIEDYENNVKFGELIQISLDVYKGDSTKNVISVYVKDNENNKISYVSKIYAYDSYTEYPVSIPLQLKPNCDYDYDAQWDCTDESVTTDPVSVTFNSGKAKTTWASEWQSDGVGNPSTEPSLI